MDFYRQQLREQRHRLPPQVTYHGVVTLPRRNTLMKLSVSTCTRLLGCGATPTVGFSTPARTQSAAGRGVSMMAKSIFKTSAALSPSAPWRRQHLHLYTAVVWHVTLKRKLRLVVVVNRKAPAKPLHRAGLH